SYLCVTHGVPLFSSKIWLIYIACSTYAETDEKDYLTRMSAMHQHDTHPRKVIHRNRLAIERLCAHLFPGPQLLLIAFVLPDNVHTCTLIQASCPSQALSINAEVDVVDATTVELTEGSMQEGKANAF